MKQLSLVPLRKTNQLPTNVFHGKQPFTLLLTLLLAMMLLITGCSPAAPAAANEPAGTPAAESTAPAVAEANTPVDPDAEIVLAGRRNLAPGERDAYYCSSILFVWEPLVSQDSNASPIPGLAEDWEMSEDGHQWTFHLRQGVTFHDGTPFDADAVLANFERMGGEVKTSSFYPLHVDTHYPNLQEVLKVDDHTVQLVFSQPAPTQLYNMVNFGSAMYSPHNFSEDGYFNGLAQGTGPFRLVENVLDEYLVLERNEDYYGEKAVANTIRIRVIPDVDTRFAAMKAEEIMGVLDLSAITPALAEELVKDERFGLSSTKSTMIRFLIPNGTTFPFDDVRMRQAASLIIDRETFVNELHHGFGTPTTNILNYSTPFYHDIPVAYDPEKAKALAAEVLGDQRMPITFYVNGGEPLQKTEAELLSVWFSEIGLDATIQVMEWTAVREEMKAGTHHLARAQQGLSNSEAATIFRRFMLPDGDQNVGYRLGYDNPRVNELMAAVDGELNLDRRHAIYQEIQEISAEEQPIIPLFNDVTLLVFNKKLANYDAQVYGLDLPAIGWAE
ncbi:ABC transporter substrate-binding protein [Anoxynatronum buryatiense]|uniref:Peptide/nickel transport system substrate-binding protein n=1 Tax=Anoxynatronum buryatiense TaxID=489973 RepID=A0AA45WUZ1_9CLOT|nr:ABC transporter substrate-binding protein [Anoxynatronum buryatiense]SMP51092.1 peptide/nickel transport system substrate-binding protein [Anoxynatronum buryatiense]